MLEIFLSAGSMTGYRPFDRFDGTGNNGGNNMMRRHYYRG
jgi:hypothetical protein